MKCAKGPVVVVWLVLRSGADPFFPFKSFIKDFKWSILGLGLATKKAGSATLVVYCGSIIQAVFIYFHKYVKEMFGFC